MHWMSVASVAVKIGFAVGRAKVLWRGQIVLESLGEDLVKGGYGARHGIVNLAARGMLRCVGGAAARVGGSFACLCAAPL